MNTNAELKKLLRDAQEDFDISSRSSRERALQNLKPGQPAPGEGRIYGDDRQKFKERTTGRRLQAMAIIDEAEKATRDRLSAPPSEEALRAVQLLQLRPHPSEDDLSSLLARYGDNCMIHAAVRDIAADKGAKLFIGEHPEEVRLAQIENVRRSVGRVLTPAPETEADERPSDGLLSFVALAIDEAFHE